MPARLGPPWDQSRLERIIGVARGFLVHLQKPHDQLDGLGFGFAHFIFGDLQRADDALSFRGPDS